MVKQMKTGNARMGAFLIVLYHKLIKYNIKESTSKMAKPTICQVGCELIKRSCEERHLALWLKRW
jgi:hypothetical protein